MRRSWIPAALALLLVPLTVAGVLRSIVDPPPTALPFSRPPHRVAMAVDAAMRAEMVSVGQGAHNLFFPDPEGLMAAMGSATPKPSDRIPEDSPNFWTQVPGSPRPALMYLHAGDIQATARDGRVVTASIKQDPFGQGSVVDFHGDAEAARLLSGPIARHLARPAHRHDSPEDRAALMAFFGPSTPRAPAPIQAQAGIQVVPALLPAGAEVDLEIRPR